jgi:hypothetical protein
VRGKEAEDALALMAVRIRDFATGEERDRLSRENERLCKEITRLEANCLAREEWREDMIRWMDECHRLADEVKRLKALLGEETP